MLSCPILDYLSTYGKINPQNSKTDNENVSAKENVEATQKDSTKKEELPVSYSLKKKYSISGLQSIHKVKSNETLSMIARRIYGHKEFSKYIVQYNNISNPDNIVVGTALRIPALKEKQN